MQEYIIDELLLNDIINIIKLKCNYMDATSILNRISLLQPVYEENNNNQDDGTIGFNASRYQEEENDEEFEEDEELEDKKSKKVKK